MPHGDIPPPDGGGGAGNESISANRPNLRLIHDENSFERSSLAYWRDKTISYTLDSLRSPTNPDYEPLVVRADGTVLNGNTRLFVLREHGYNINTIPWRPIS